MDRIPIAYTVCESSLSDTEQNRCLTGVKILGKKKKGGWAPVFLLKVTLIVHIRSTCSLVFLFLFIVVIDFPYSKHSLDVCTPGDCDESDQVTTSARFLETSGACGDYLLRGSRIPKGVIVKKNR